jgi:RNA polymerase sigma-70 factor (ECF subfamily)
MHELEEVRRRYGPVVWKTVYRILRDHSEALDCYQDVFCEILQRLWEGGVDNWPGYLRWLATRRALDRLRSRRRHRARLEPVDAAEVPAGGPGPGERAEFGELVDLVRYELTKLPDRQAEAFWLRCVEEMTYEEIGRQMALDTSTVGVLIHRARSRLRIVLAELAPGGLRE